MNQAIPTLRYHALILATLAALTGCGGSSSSDTEPPPATPTPTPTPPPSGEAPQVGDIIPLDGLVPGTCVEQIEEGVAFNYLTVMDCNQPHSFEVVGTVQRPEGSGSEFPGRIDIDRTAHQSCRPLFEEHTGQSYTGQGLGIETITPSRNSWSQGDRSIVCLVVSADRQPLTAPTANRSAE